MKIESSLLITISELAGIELNQKEKEDLLGSLNSLIEDFSCLHDFQVEEKIKNTCPISLRKDNASKTPYLQYLHRNFPHQKDHLLIAPLIQHDEK